mgnify:CR=1 FL=1
MGAVPRQRQQVREALGLKPDTELVLFMDEAGFRVELADWTGRGIETGDDGLPILAQVDAEQFTADEVRSIRHALQR